MIEILFLMQNFSQLMYVGIIEIKRIWLVSGILHAKNCKLHAKTLKKC